MNAVIGTLAVWHQVYAVWRIVASINVFNPLEGKGN